MPRTTKTYQALARDRQFDRNYDIMSQQTGISKKRLRDLYKGEKATRSEINKISFYDRKPHTISPDVLSKYVGFTPGEIKRRMTYPEKYTVLQKGKKVTKRFEGKRLAERRSLNFDYLRRMNDGTIRTVRPKFQNRTEEEYIYYVRLFENHQTGEVMISQGFLPVSHWKSRKLEAGDTRYRWTETKYKGNEPYYSYYWYFDVLNVPDLANLVKSTKRTQAAYSKTNLAQGDITE